MKKNEFLFAFCVLAIFLYVGMVLFLRITLLKQSKIVSSIITGSIDKSFNSGDFIIDMGSDKDINKTPIFDSSYDSMLEELREKYKQKLNVIKDEYNEKLKKNAYDALGTRFSMLLSERVLLLRDFEAITKKMLTEGGLSTNNENFKQLTEWAKSGAHKDKENGKRIFLQVIDAVSQINPELGEKTRLAERALEENHRLLEEHLNLNRDKMKQSEVQTKAEMRKDITKLILDYNLELKKLRQQFNLTPTKLESPFDTNESQEKGEKSLSDPSNIEVDNVFGDDLFIIKKKNTDDLN